MKIFIILGCFGLFPIGNTFQNRSATEPQNRRTAEPQNRRTAEPDPKENKTNQIETLHTH